MHAGDIKQTIAKVHRLIELQRRLAGSRSPFLRRVGVLLATGALDRHLSDLDDRQIAQLLADEVDRQLPLFQPESAICRPTTNRLLGSQGNSSLKASPETNESRI